MNKDDILEIKDPKGELDCMSEEDSQDVSGGLNLKDLKKLKMQETRTLEKCPPMVAYGFIDPTKKLKERLLDTKPVLEDENPFSPDN